MWGRVAPRRVLTQFRFRSRLASGSRSQFGKFVPLFAGASFLGFCAYHTLPKITQQADAEEPKPCPNVPLDQWEKKPSLIFVLGGPGAGKSTQCKRLVDRFGYVHLSAGDLLRKECANPASKHGELISQMLKVGAIVPASVTVALLRQAIEEAGTHKFLIDGFPRNFENNAVFESDLQGFVNVQYLVYFDCPEDVMEQRILGRASSSGRTDDNLSTARKRFAIFNEETRPVIAYYENKNKVAVVNANQTAEAVEAQLVNLFLDLQKREAQAENPNSTTV